MKPKVKKGISNLRKIPGIFILIAAVLDILYIVYILWPRKSDYSITITGKCNSFSIPDTMKQLIVNFADYLYNEKLGYASNNRLKELTADVYMGRILSLGYQYTFKVTNTGKREITDLILEVQNTGWYSYIDQNNKIENAIYINNIKLGDLRPSNSLYVILWTQYRPYNKIKVTHKDGFSYIEYPIEVSGVLAWLIKNPLFVLGIIYFLIVIVYSVFKLVVKKDYQVKVTNDRTLF